MRIVHYLNQFFGGRGGEEAAHLPPHIQDGAVGPGRLLDPSLRRIGTFEGGNPVLTKLSC